jgi:hypothetical protein
MRGEPQLLLWIILGLTLLLNVWADYRRPGWWIIDGFLILVIGMALLKRWSK